MVHYKWEKEGLVGQNQDLRGQSVYHELRNFTKTYFSGYRMMLGTTDNTILNLEFFCWLSILHQNQQNFKIMIKMIPLQGSDAHQPEAQYFYLKFWY